MVIKTGKKSNRRKNIYTDTDLAPMKSEYYFFFGLSFSDAHNLIPSFEVAVLDFHNPHANALKTYSYWRERCVFRGRKKTIFFLIEKNWTIQIVATENSQSAAFLSVFPCWVGTNKSKMRFCLESRWCSLMYCASLVRFSCSFLTHSTIYRK